VDSSGSGWGSVMGYCEHGSEPLGSVKGGELLDQLRDNQLLIKDSAPWSLLINYLVRSENVAPCLCKEIV
jgi:hypothetical protein